MIDLRNQHMLLRVLTGYIKIIDNFCVICRTNFAGKNGSKNRAI